MPVVGRRVQPQRDARIVAMLSRPARRRAARGRRGRAAFRRRGRGRRVVFGHESRVVASLNEGGALQMQAFGAGIGDADPRRHDDGKRAGDPDEIRKQDCHRKPSAREPVRRRAAASGRRAIAGSPAAGGLRRLGTPGWPEAANHTMPRSASAAMTAAAGSPVGIISSRASAFGL